MDIHPSARGFEAAAGDYERARPDYPDGAGRWLAERLDRRGGRKVLDLAAGTGKLTRLLVATASDGAGRGASGRDARASAAVAECGDQFEHCVKRSVERFGVAFDLTEQQAAL